MIIKLIFFDNFRFIMRYLIISKRGKAGAYRRIKRVKALDRLERTKKRKKESRLKLEGVLLDAYTFFKHVDKKHSTVE